MLFSPDPCDVGLSGTLLGGTHFGTPRLQTWCTFGNYFETPKQQVQVCVHTSKAITVRGTYGGRLGRTHAAFGRMRGQFVCHAQNFRVLPGQLFFERCDAREQTWLTHGVVRLVLRTTKPMRLTFQRCNAVG